MMRICLPAVFTLTLGASEVAVRDLRAGVLFRPVSIEFTVSGDTVEASGSDDWNAGGQLEFGGRWSFSPVGSSLGLVVGADGGLEGLGDGDGGTLATLSGRASLGGAWAISDRFTAILEAGGTVGVSSLDMPASGRAPAYTADGSMLGYDLRLSGSWRFSRRFALEGVLGWMAAGHELSGDGLDIDLDRDGLFVGIGFVWRLSNAPTRLE